MFVLLAAFSAATALNCGDDSPSAGSRDHERRFVLGISADGSVTLDGKPVHLSNLPAESTRLAQRVRSEEQNAGRQGEPENGPPAVILVWAADDVPYSVIAPRMFGCQAGGFRHWKFAIRSVYPDPANIPPSRAVRSQARKKESDLPEMLRTLPVRARADGRGRLRRVEVAEQELDGIGALRRELAEIRKEPNLPFDRVFLKVDSRLVFSELVRVLEVIADSEFTKVDLGEIGPGDEG
jgi:biopolymer transport protein ExbD